MGLPLAIIIAGCTLLLFPLQSICNCVTDSVQLIGGASSYGIAQYCYQGEDGSVEWISLCGVSWNTRLTELVCRQITNTSVPINELVTDHMTSEVYNRSLSLTCPGGATQLSNCTGSITTQPCLAIDVTCKGSCSSICACTEGWSGFRCNTANCNLTCINGGTCSRPGECSNCDSGFGGDTCSEFECDCLNGGNCTGPGICTCTPGWTMDRCEQAVCNLGCANGGNCTAPEVCTCTHEWEGERCTEAICREGFCMNEGNCSYPNTNCTCSEKWTGDICHIAICDPDCLNGGDCTSPNNCTCPSGWIGNRCQIDFIAENPGSSTTILYIACMMALLLIVFTTFLSVCAVIRCVLEKKIIINKNIRVSPNEGRDDVEVDSNVSHGATSTNEAIHEASYEETQQKNSGEVIKLKENMSYKVVGAAYEEHKYEVLDVPHKAVSQAPNYEEVLIVPATPQGLKHDYVLTEPDKVVSQVSKYNDASVVPNKMVAATHQMTQYDNPVPAIPPCKVIPTASQYDDVVPACKVIPTAPQYENVIPVIPPSKVILTTSQYENVLPAIPVIPTTPQYDDVVVPPKMVPGPPNEQMHGDLLLVPNKLSSPIPPRNTLRATIQDKMVTNTCEKLPPLF